VDNTNTIIASIVVHDDEKRKRAVFCFLCVSVGWAYINIFSL